MEFPKDLKYTASDEWVRLEGKTATVGVSDYAQSQLSDIVFVEVTAAVGETLEKGKAFASVESVKAASEIYMPVKGKIVAVNDALPGTPEQWFETATQHPGSWWDDWQAWIARQNGGEMVAARVPQDPLEDAPGSYATLRLGKAA